MNDIRLQLPECPLEYEVPLIPGTHALAITVSAPYIDWQEKMLPWTLASLINNTDLVMEGVHLYIVCHDGTEDRVRTALKGFDLPERAIMRGDTKSTVDYESILLFNINYWAFRDGKNQIKLPVAQAIKDYANHRVMIEDPPSSPFDLKAPCMCDMTHAKAEDYSRAIKHLMAAQLAMKV